MKAKFLLVAIALTGCGPMPGPSPTRTFSVDVFGMAYYNSRYHFIKTELPSRQISIINESDSIQTGLSSDAAISYDANEYYYISGRKMIVLSTLTGEFIKSFNIKYPNTVDLVYNAISKKLNALSFINGSYDFVEINVKNEKMALLSSLQEGVLVTPGTASISNSGATYYFATQTNSVEFQAIDTRSGSIVDTYDMLSSLNANGVVGMSDTTLFGMGFLPTGKRFFVYNTALGKIRMLAPFLGTVMNTSNKTIVDNTYFYSSDIHTLTGIDTETGMSISNTIFPYEIYNLVPVHRQ